MLSSGLPIMLAVAIADRRHLDKSSKIAPKEQKLVLV